MKEVAFVVYRKTNHPIELGRPYSILENLGDRLIKIGTKGKYTHCEIAFDNKDGTYLCYSSVFAKSSFTKAENGKKPKRKNGVRKVEMKLSENDFDFLPIMLDREEIEKYFQETQYQKYDLRGAVGTIFKNKQSEKRQFCNEWVINAILGKVEIQPNVFSYQGWRSTPSGTPAVLSELTKQARQFIKEKEL